MGISERELIHQQDIELERLRKEKEWLVSTLLGTWRVDIEDEEDCVLRGFILKEMQQALKEIKK